MFDDVCVNDLEAVGTFEGLRLCDQPGAGRFVHFPKIPSFRRSPI
jgi:hypothetical protein